jgi:hypothetical protein
MWRGMFLGVERSQFGFFLNLGAMFFVLLIRRTKNAASNKSGDWLAKWLDILSDLFSDRLFKLHFR